MMDKQTERQINTERGERWINIRTIEKKKKEQNTENNMFYFFFLYSYLLLHFLIICFFLFQRYVLRRSFMKSDISLPIDLAIILSYFSFLVHHRTLSSSSLFRSPIFFYLRFLFLHLNIFLSKKLQLHTANISFPFCIHQQTMNNSN